MINQSSSLFISNYYAGLLISQYAGLVRAPATIAATSAQIVLSQTPIKTLVFASAPASGSFIVNYGGSTTSPINWNDSTSTIQTKIQGITALAAATVSGTIAGLTLTLTLTNVPPPSTLMSITSNTLGVGIQVNEVDVTLPFAVQSGFNLIGPNYAVGAQLDILGKYAGVTRTGAGFNGQIVTLSDTDFLTLIQFAIIKNNAGSSLSVIQALLHQFFPNEVLVFDYANMQMSYLISSAIGSQNLVQLLVEENLLPKPMGVQLAVVVYAPIITTFLEFRTYDLPIFNGSPANSYDSYNLNAPWLTYDQGIFI